MKGIILDDNYELLLEKTDEYAAEDTNGRYLTRGITVGDNTEQNIRLTLLCMAGEAKGDPEGGVGISRAVSGSLSPFLKGEIRTQLLRQKIDPKNITISETGISIDI